MGAGLQRAAKAARATQKRAPKLETVFDYLDTLRESGATNMYGAGLYLRSAFSMQREETHRVLGLWMKTFGDGKQTPAARAKLAKSLTKETA